MSQCPEKSCRKIFQKHIMNFRRGVSQSLNNIVSWSQDIVDLRNSLYIKTYEFWRGQNTEGFGADKLLEHLLHIVVQRYNMDICQTYSKIWRMYLRNEPVVIGQKMEEEKSMQRWWTTHTNIGYETNKSAGWLSMPE